MLRIAVSIAFSAIAWIIPSVVILILMCEYSMMLYRIRNRYLLGSLVHYNGFMWMKGVVGINWWSFVTSDHGSKFYDFTLEYIQITFRLNDK
jgi:hypothetical protein